jgi:hypothetical protein
VSEPETAKSQIQAKEGLWVQWRAEEVERKMNCSEYLRGCRKYEMSIGLLQFFRANFRRTSPADLVDHAG